MSEAYGHASANEAMQWLLAAMCRELGAEACLVLRLNGAGTEGVANWLHGEPMQALSRSYCPVAGSELERTLTADDPLPFELTTVARDPWLANLGISAGAMVALRQGPVRFGSLGICYTHAEVDAASALAVLAEIRTVIWPLLCWQMLGSLSEMERLAQHMATCSSVLHQANNILSNIVLLSDTAAGLPNVRQDPALTELMHRFASESMRCAEILRELVPTQAGTP